MEIELKNVKIYHSMSEETYCFEATLYADNKKITRVSNSGRGADNDYDDWKKVVAINDWCKSNLPKWTSEYSDDKFDTTIDMVIADLLNRHNILKDYKKAIRKGVVQLPNNLEGDEYGVVKWPTWWKHATEKQKNVWLNAVYAFKSSEDKYVLNALPKDQAEKLWIEFNTNDI